jgi:HPt (histidine-containing phosphotransfer) domain-containing protein
MKKKNIAFACAAFMSLAGCDSSIDVTSAYVTKAKPIIGALVNTLEEANQARDIAGTAVLDHAIPTQQFISAVCQEDRYFLANSTITSVSVFNKTVGDLTSTDAKTLGAIAASIRKNLSAPKQREVKNPETPPTCATKVGAIMKDPIGTSVDTTKSVTATVSAGLALLKALTALAAQIEKELRAKAIEEKVVAFANDSEVQAALEKLPLQVEQAVTDSKRYALLRAYAFFAEAERLKKLPAGTPSVEERQLRILDAATGFNAFAEKYRSLDASQPEKNAAALVNAINKYVAYVKDGKRTAGEAFDNFMNAIAELDDAYDNFDTARSKYKEMTK